ncbi:MAG: hypothetical protein EXS37_14280 [Opitutus sp.]|nr:hypothetical protein [Opitutus sp.]
MSFTRAILPLFLVAAASAAEKGPGLPKNSPFMPVGTTPGAVAAANENFEFAGVSSVGKRTDLIFYDKTAKKSHWIGIGETKEGIAVLNYDARREQAVVKVNGVEKILSLRKGTGPVNTAGGVSPLPTGFNIPPPTAAPQPITMPAPAPVAPPPTMVMPDPASSVANQPAAKPEAPATPEAQVRQETEARMLVSDLLEIGMAQRKAYEEAQRKASEGANAQTPPPPKS